MRPIAKWTVVAAISISAMVAAQLKAQGTVGGEAGRDARIVFSGGCYNVTNLSPDRRIKVTMGIYSMDVQVGETKQLRISSTQCVTGYVGDTTAVYIDPPRPGTTPPTVVVVTPTPTPTPTPGPTATAAPCRPTEIRRGATAFDSGLNVAPASGETALYGPGVLLNAPPYNARPNSATYRITACGGTYSLHIEYAAAQARPVIVRVNGETVSNSALNSTTGGWTPGFQRWDFVSNVYLNSGGNTLVISRGDVFPHIRAIRLTPTR